MSDCGGGGLCTCRSGDTSVQQRDLGAILTALGLGDHARPHSPHDVVHREVLPAIAALSSSTAAVAQRLYEMNGFAWYGRDLGRWDDPASDISRNEFERGRWLRQAKWASA